MPSRGALEIISVFQNPPTTEGRHLRPPPAAPAPAMVTETSTAAAESQDDFHAVTQSLKDLILDQMS